VKRGNSPPACIPGGASREDNRTVCPIPHVGYCVYERCNFWDEAAQECSGECIGEYEPLDAAPNPGGGPCTIYWTEDAD
jgi:hypothetical protein